MSQRFLNGSTDFYSFLRMLETQAAALPDGNNYQTLLNHMYSDPLYAYLRIEEPGITSEERSARLSESVSALTEISAQTYAPDAIVDAAARSLSDDIMLHAYDVSNGDVAWQDLPAGLEERLEAYTSEPQPAVEAPTPELAVTAESNAGFFEFLERLNAGIATEDGFDYNRDLLTYIQSDIHYVAAIERSLESSTLPQEEKDSIVEAARAAFAESERVVMDPDYEFDIDKLSLAGEIINAGFNGDSERLDMLAETIIENGGHMPLIDNSAPDSNIFAAPTDPEDAPAQDTGPVEEHESSPGALTLTVTEGIVLTSAFTNAATDIADASVLLNGVAADDMEFLEDLVEEARELGVDTELLTSISAEISSNDFVTSQAAAEGVRAYAETLKTALENDDLITNDEYKGALTNLFTGIAGGMVVDRIGLADDIAAAPGMEEQATRLMREALQGARPQTLGMA